MTTISPDRHARICAALTATAEKIAAEMTARIPVLEAELASLNEREAAIKRELGRA